jgi:hypothetical protein
MSAVTALFSWLIFVKLASIQVFKLIVFTTLFRFILGWGSQLTFHLVCY